MSDFFGKDCPKGMVQVEFVGCPIEEKNGEYGWKPVKHAFIEVWVDGRRFNIQIGTFNDGSGEKRGLHIISDLELEWQQTAINSASISFKESSNE